MSYQILVVDDDPGMLETLPDIFEEIGYGVEVASDGDIAVKMAATTEFDLILMDIRMPQMDGVTALEQMLKQRPGQLVVMMTGYAEHLMIKRAKKLGARGVFPKPLDIMALIKTINQLLEGQ